MMAKYGQAIDRDSARERLARKLEAGAQAAEAERQAAEAERAGPRGQPSRSAAAARAAERTEARGAAAARQPKPEPGSRRRACWVPSAFREFTRTAGREIVRSIFGTGRRRR